MSTRIDIIVTYKQRMRTRAFWVSLYVVVFGLGIWANSSAMQWFGFIAILIAAVAYAASEVKKNTGLTIAEARKRLDEIERDAALEIKQRSE